MISALTPLEMLARSASVYADRVAVVDGDRRLTYAAFADRAARLAGALAGLGVVPGDRVAVLAPNGTMALEAQFGPMRIGALLVMLNTRLAAPELTWILNHCEAKVLIADPQLAQALEPVRHELTSLKYLVTDYEAFLDSAPALPPLSEEPEENAPIAINYTSGTTGVPKGVMYTHRGAYLNALGEIVEHGLDSHSVYLWTVPMFHCNGWCFPWAVTAAGARHVMLRQVDPVRAVALIRGEGVTHLGGAPVVVASLTRHCASQGIRFEGLKIVIAGAPPTPAVIREAEEMGAEITHVYGLTETYGPHTICVRKDEWTAMSAAERAHAKARQGVPYLVAGTALRVVDELLRDVPADGVTMGEVVMRGNNVMLGYYRNPDATAEAFEGGWFHSGDLAVVHPDGYIEVRDSAKDIVISGGENISSIEVEKVLAEHPAVAEAAVVAFPDERWGEVPKAFITLKPDSHASPDELIAWCRERMSHFKCPRVVEFGTIPRTATGKIRKNELRKKISEAGAGA